MDSSIYVCLGIMIGIIITLFSFASIIWCTKKDDKKKNNLEVIDSEVLYEGLLSWMKSMEQQISIYRKALEEYTTKPDDKK